MMSRRAGGADSQAELLRVPASKLLARGYSCALSAPVGLDGVAGFDAARCRAVASEPASLAWKVFAKKVLRCAHRHQ